MNRQKMILLTLAFLSLSLLVAADQPPQTQPARRLGFLPGTHSNRSGISIPEVAAQRILHALRGDAIVGIGNILSVNDHKDRKDYLGMRVSLEMSGGRESVYHTEVILQKDPDQDWSKAKVFHPEKALFEVLDPRNAADLNANLGTAK